MISRSLVSLFFALAILAYYRKNPLINVPYGPLIGRAAVGAIAKFFYNFGVYVLPISHVILIGLVAPFLASVLGYFINGEPIYFYEVSGMLLISIGIALFTLSGPDSIAEESSEEESEVTWWYAAGVGCVLVSSLFYALICTLIRKMKDIHFSVI